MAFELFSGPGDPTNKNQGSSNASVDAPVMLTGPHPHALRIDSEVDSIFMMFLANPFWAAKPSLF
jgi:hypothetical protein